MSFVWFIIKCIIETGKIPSESQRTPKISTSYGIDVVVDITLKMTFMQCSTKVLFNETARNFQVLCGTRCQIIQVFCFFKTFLWVVSLQGKPVRAPLQITLQRQVRVINIRSLSSLSFSEWMFWINGREMQETLVLLRWRRRQGIWPEKEK